MDTSRTADDLTPREPRAPRAREPGEIPPVLPEGHVASRHAGPQPIAPRPAAVITAASTLASTSRETPPTPSASFAAWTSPQGRPPGRRLAQRAHELRHRIVAVRVQPGRQVRVTGHVTEQHHLRLQGAQRLDQPPSLECAPGCSVTAHHSGTLLGHRCRVATHGTTDHQPGGLLPPRPRVRHLPQEGVIGAGSSSLGGLRHRERAAPQRSTRRTR